MAIRISQQELEAANLDLLIGNAIGLILLYVILQTSNTNTADNNEQPASLAEAWDT
jgi:hypothetical protein